MVLHPRITLLLWALGPSLLVLGWLDGAGQFVVVAAILLTTQALARRWQGRALRRSIGAKAARREHYADWYRRHPDHDPPEWLQSG
jgi:hypothetical protein